MSDDTKVIHTFIKPIKYTPKNAGDQLEAQFIELSEPSVRNLSACALLKQAFMRALADNSSDSVEVDTGAEVEVDTVPMETRIMNALYTSDTDMTKVFLAAKDLFKDVGLIDGEKKCTVPLLDEMGIEDLERMTGKYMANFILASVLKDQ